MKSFRTFCESVDIIRQYVDSNDLTEKDYHSSEPGDVVERVIWGRIPKEIECHSLSAVDLPSHSGIYAVHVTSDSDYWIDRLWKDYDRPKRSAKVISIRIAPGDILVEDNQYSMDPDGGDRADSAILLTTRRVLRRGTDFVAPRDKFDDEKAPVSPDQELARLAHAREAAERIASGKWSTEDAQTVEAQWGKRVDWDKLGSLDGKEFDTEYKNEIVRVAKTITN